jgi:SAM-dependent methyltransferase
MLGQLTENYPYAETILGDVRDVGLSDGSVDSVFVNACYPNIADKAGAFSNIGRMTRPGGRLVISHPLGKSFIEALKGNVPFPVDDFPERGEAEMLLGPFGFGVKEFIDEPKLYILVATRNGRRADGVPELDHGGSREPGHPGLRRRRSAAWPHRG